MHYLPLSDTRFDDLPYHMTMPVTPQREFFTLQEVADKLGFNRMTVYRYVVKKRLPSYKFGRHYRVRKDDFENFIVHNKV